MMRKIFLAASLMVLAAILVFGSGNKPAVAQRPTSTLTPTPYPLITVVIGNFALTGTRGVNSVPTTVLNAVTSLDLRTVNLIRTQAILTADAAQQAAERYSAALVIWGAPEGTAANRHLVVHYDMLGRQAVLDANPLTRRGVTLTGLFGLPDSAEITAFAGIPVAAVTAFTQAQLYLALTDDARAKELLLAADQASTNIKVTVAADNTFANWFRSEVTFYRAYLALRDGSTDVALDRFQQILAGEARPGIVAWTNINAGALSLQRQRLDNAVSLLEQAVTLDEGAELAYVNLGAAYWRQGDASKAMTTLDKAVELDSRNTYALNDRGYVLYQANQPDAALQNFRQVLDIDPNFIDAYINQASLYRTTGELDLALRDINTAIKLTSQRDSYPYVLRGDIYYARGEYDLALADLETALKLDAENDYAQTLRGDIFAKQGRDAEALNAFTLAISLTPTNPYPYLQRAQTYLKFSKFKEAALDATSALELGKADPAAYVDGYFYRAEAYSGLNRFDDAIADYQEYLAQSADGKYVDVANARIASLRAFFTPSPTVVSSSAQTPTPVGTLSSAELNQRGDSLVEQGRDGDALGPYTSSILQNPSDPYPYLQRAKVWLKINRYKEAALDATSALELGKANPNSVVEAYFIRAESFVGLNRYDEAVADYETYLTQAPNGKFANAAKARVASIRVYVTPTVTPVPPTATLTPTATK